MPIRTRSFPGKLLKKRNPHSSRSGSSTPTSTHHKPRDDQPAVPPIPASLLPPVELYTSLDIPSTLTRQPSTTTPSTSSLTKPTPPFYARSPNASSSRRYPQSHRRSRSFSELLSYISATSTDTPRAPSFPQQSKQIIGYGNEDEGLDRDELTYPHAQPWRSREAWAALHTPPGTPRAGGHERFASERDANDNDCVLDRGYGWLAVGVDMREHRDSGSAFNDNANIDQCNLARRQVSTSDLKRPPIPPRSASRPRLPLSSLAPRGQSTFPGLSSPLADHPQPGSQSLFYQQPIARHNLNSGYFPPSTALPTDGPRSVPMSRTNSGYSSTTTTTSESMETPTPPSSENDHDHHRVDVILHTPPRTTGHLPESAASPSSRTSRSSSRTSLAKLPKTPSTSHRYRHPPTAYPSFPFTPAPATPDYANGPQNANLKNEDITTSLELPPLLPSTAHMTRRASEVGLRSFSPTPGYTSPSATPIPWAQQSPEKSATRGQGRQLRHVPSPLSLWLQRQPNAAANQRIGTTLLELKPTLARGGTPPPSSRPALQTHHLRKRSMTAPSIFATLPILSTPMHTPTPTTSSFYSKPSSTLLHHSRSPAPTPAPTRPLPSIPAEPILPPQQSPVVVANAISPRSLQRRAPIADLRVFNTRNEQYKTGSKSQRSAGASGSVGNRQQLGSPPVRAGVSMGLLPSPVGRGGWV